MPDRKTPPLGYAGLVLDRHAERREDEAFIEAEARDPAARTAVFIGDRPVLRSGPDAALAPLFDAEGLAGLGPLERGAYLGRDADGPRFVALLGEGADDVVARSDDLVCEDLRGFAQGGRLGRQDLALLGYAKSMAIWRARCRFCPNCGTELLASASGWRRRCPGCGALHFPRADPVAIVLVTYGGRCLLGRQSRFPPGMWSCLAGFVEPGETIEDAARREMFEEAGVRLGEVRYELSQPWPFPSQLMIGLSAEALGDVLTPDLDELEDARWFPRDEAEAMLRRAHPDGLYGPHPSAIAHHLIRRFVYGG